MRKINSITGVQTLKGVLELWQKESSNENEEFWQETLTTNSFVLEQVFSWPCTILNSKAYVGGKNIFNKKGNIVDFLMKNSLTNNVALIEIKTPQSLLLSNKYRQVYNVSSELSGSVLQVANYKHSLGRSYNELTGGQGNLFQSFNPKCVIVIGNTNQFEHDTDKQKSFELFRNQLVDVQVITYDELFCKIENLVKALESCSEKTS